MTAILRLLALGVVLWVSAASAQSPAPSTTPAQPAPSTAPAQPKIDSVVLAVLIKSAVVAVQQANATGNYSVLRDLGTPIFRERYDQVKLANIFSNLRGVNLNGALLLMPNLTKQPELTPQGQLHVVGNFPTQPLEIRYEALFVQLDGIWRLDGIAVYAVPPGSPEAAASPAAGSSDAQAAQDPSKRKAAFATKKAKGAAVK
jgi:hypothetical protein